jgi:hypothetical protein
MTTGTVMIFVSPEGRVIAHAACFERSAPGGFTSAEAQHSRCARLLDTAVFDALCSPALTEATTDYQRGCVVQTLLSKGYRSHTITVEVPA